MADLADPVHDLVALGLELVVGYFLSHSASFWHACMPHCFFGSLVTTTESGMRHCLDQFPRVSAPVGCTSAVSLPKATEGSQVYMYHSIVIRV